MIGGATLRALVRDTLRLRGAALPLLAGAPLADDDLAALRGASSSAWALLVHAEACALPLAAALRARAGLPETIPAAARAELAAGELREVQQVLEARQLLAALDAACVAAGVRATVIKGGIAAATGTGVDLRDVDVRMTAGDAALLWTRLIGDGWTPMGYGGAPEAGRALDDARHYAPIVPPGGRMHLEIHQRTAYSGAGDSAADPAPVAPLARFGALDAPAAADAVEMILRHAVWRHPWRRGHLRDLVLVGDVVRGADADLLAAVRARFAGDPVAPELCAMLDQSAALCAGERPADGARDRLFVAQKYATVFRRADRVRDRVAGWFSSTIPLERPPVRRALYRDEVRLALQPPEAGNLLRSAPVTRRLYARAPLLLTLPRTAAYLLRLAVLVAAAPVARRRARRLAAP